MLDLDVGKSHRPEAEDPKTDYTYSRSGSYSKTHVDTGYISPNMSRRRLKGVGDNDSLTTSSVTSSSYSPGIRRNAPVIRLDESYLRSVENDNVQQQEVKAEATQPAHYTHGGEFSDQEFEEPSSRLLGVHGLRIPASETRSGKKYGKKWAPGSKEALAARARRRSSRGRSQGGEEVSDTEGETGSEYSVGLNDVASYRKFEKQLEYSGHESLMKETRLNHLYGLDNSDVEFSDTEQTESVEDNRLQAPYARRTVHRAHSKSTLSTISTFIYSILTTILTAITGQAVPGAVVGSANKLQRGLARTVINDTWILSRTGYLRRAYGCCCCLLPLLLIPLLLTCAYYLYDRGLYQSSIIPVVPAPLPVLPKDPSPPVAAGAVYTDEDLAARVQTILIGLLKEREVHTHTILTADWRAWADKFAAGQTSELNTHKKDVDARIAALVTERVEQLAVGMGTQSEEDSAIQMAALAGQREKMTSLEGQLAAVIGLSDGLKEQLAMARKDMRSQDEEVRQSGAEAVANLEGKLDALAAELRNLQSSHSALAAAFKDCCKNDSSLALLIRKGVEEHLAAILGGSGGGGLPMGGPGASSQTTFLSWLHSQFVGRDDMDSRLAALLAKIEDDIKATSSEAHNAATLAAAAAAAAAANKATESSTTKQQTTIVGGVATGGVTEEHVRILIQNALMLYSADKTGKVDYALESAGGSVVSTRCSETYHRRTAQLSLFGIPLWYTSNSPRTVIQPDMQPGQCWAFRGDTGFLVIQLAGLVRPTAFTLEHIPKTLSPSGKIDSAPKGFSVLGLQHDRDMDGVFLGNYTYSADSEPLQTFIVTESNREAFPIVELRILSNHGNKEYTCLYRFRVHGVSKL